MLLLIIILALLFAGGGGYYGYSRWGAGGGLGIVGTVIVIVLVLYLLGAVRYHLDSAVTRSAASHTRAGRPCPSIIFWARQPHPAHRSFQSPRAPCQFRLFLR
jgi:hypothetical protein